MFLKSRLFAAVAIFCGSALAASNVPDATFVVQDSLQVPGSKLEPGKYKLSLQQYDLPDRAIVRLTGEEHGTNVLLLAIPNRSLTGSGKNEIIKWNAKQSSDQALRGWTLPEKNGSLEFVYPKEEAAALANKVSERVVAVDPASEKLPALPAMSADDMKIVNLWLLSYNKTAPSEPGKLAAAHYQPSSADSEVMHPKSEGQMASSRKSLPRTASNNGLWMLAGLLLLSASLLTRFVRRSGRFNI